MEKTGKALRTWCKEFCCQPYFNGEYVQITFLLFSDYVTIDLTIIDHSDLVSDTMITFSYFYFQSFLSFHISLLNISKVSKYVLNNSLNVFVSQKLTTEFEFSFLRTNFQYHQYFMSIHLVIHTMIWGLLFLF